MGYRSNPFGKPSRSRTRRATVVIFAFGVFLGACSGADTDTEQTVAVGGTTEPSDTSTNSTVPQADDTTTSSEAPVGGSEAKAVMVVGDTTYEFFRTEDFPLCSGQADGSLYVAGVSANFVDPFTPTGSTLLAIIQTDDWQRDVPGQQQFDEPQIIIDDRDSDVYWNAGQAAVNYPPATYEDSAIVSSTLSEGHAEGSAIYMDQAQANVGTPVSVQGTFVIDCGS